MKLLKKFAAAAVSVVLILAALPAVPAFAETDLQTVSVNSVDFDFGRLPNSDELLAGYLQKQMYGGISLYGTTAGDRLDGIGKAIYDYLKLNIETVAAGGLDSTVFGFDLSVFSDDDINIFIQDFNTNINKILNCLLTDCPYELYWFDKTQGYSADNETVNTRLDFKFAVADAYKGEGEYAVDTAKTGAVTSAIANATEIVEENYGKSDLEKLNAYRAEICGLVSYDFEAANGGIAYGDPWQLIYVFDNDPETNVVCEGYAKAFQYLCDLSEFEDYVVCNTVTGTMDGGTGAGPHMWNIVEYGGSNYLVDVTNCDEDAIGADTELFMVGASQHPDIRTYIFNVNSSEVAYIYDEKMYDLICDGYPILSDSSPIVDIPIKSIEVADISIIENTNRYITSDYIPETDTQSPEYFRYYYSPEFTVTLNDDTVLYSEWGLINYNGQDYYLVYYDDQSYENQWTVGTHTVSADLLGFETSFDVTITASPVESVEVSDISIIEGTHGYTGEDGSYYYNDINPSFTVKLKDGRVFTSEYGAVIIDGEWYRLNIDTSKQYKEPWTAGNTYEVDCEILGAIATFNVTITASPLESVEVSDISIIEGTHGHTNEDGTYIYSNINPSFTVKLKDGRVFTSEYGAVIIDGERYWLNIDASKQSKKPWTVGNTYEAYCEILGASGTFNVTIKENIIDSLEISDISLIKDVDSYDNGFYEYYRIIPTYTLKFKDGTQKTVNNNTCVIIDGDYCYLDIDDKQEENPFEVGNTYELTGKFGTITDTFNVTVIENPVTGVEIVKAPDRTDYYVGDYLNLKGAVLRVHFNDDTYEDVKINTPTDTEEHSYYLNKLKASYYIDYVEPFTEAGKQQTKSKFLGNIFECEVDVKENNWESIEVKSGTDKSLIITAVKPDGTTEDMRILGFDWRDGGEEEGLETRDGYIFTDKGTFMGRLYCNSLNDTYKIEINELCSNIFKDSGLIKIWDYLAYSEINYNYIALITEKHFNGEITAENIDRLITVASYLDKDFGLDVCTAKTVDGKKIRELLSKNFAVNDVDLSLSEYYDGETDTYLWTEKHYYFAEPQIIDTEVNYNNEAWNVKLTAADETNMYLKLDDNLRVISINYEYIPGDLTGDNNINTLDGLMLLRYLNGWDVDIASSDAIDVNGDGKINTLDGLILMRYLNGWDVTLGGEK